MPTLPASGDISNNARTEGEQKTNFEDQRDFIEILLGGNAEDALEISSGSVTPTTASAFTVDSQGASGNDNLDNIVLTNIPDGAFVLLRQLNASREITIRHEQGGSGQVSLADGANFTLGNTDVRWLGQRVGTTFVEIARFYGNQKADFRTYYGSLVIPSDIYGRESIYVPKSVMYPTTTLGASEAQIEVTGALNYPVLEFINTSDRGSQFNLVLPKRYNGGTVQVEIYWTANSTSTNGVVWGVRAVAISDDDALQATFGTEVLITDANKSSARDMNKTAESAAITIGGSPVDADFVLFQIARRTGEAGDNLAATAELIGARVHYTTDQLNDD